MKTFPHRIRNHELETESKRFFENIIPNSWISDLSPAADYGIDGIVEITRDGELRGEEFKVQLKSTDSDIEPESVNLEISAYNYYQEISKLCPVLMVLYHSKTKNIYVKWFHDFDPYYDKSGKKVKRPENAKTIGFYWNKDNLWDIDTSKQIEYDIALFKQIKTHQIRPPFNFYIKSNVKTIYDKSVVSIVSHLDTKIESLNLFNFTFDNNTKTIGVIEITDSKILCKFKMNVGVVLHLDDKILTSEDDIVDLMVVLLLITLRQANFYSYATSLAKPILNSQIIFRHNMLTMEIVKSIVNGKDWDSYVNILNNLDNYSNSLDDKNKSQIKLNIFTGLMFYNKYINQNKITNFLLKNIKNQESDLSCAYYNLGNHYRHSGKMLEAFHYYNLAQKSNKNYKERDYFWQELAGILFEYGKYKYSSESYAKALEINNCAKTFGLYADALLYSGEYQQAYEIFATYFKLINKQEKRICGEWYLKYMALNFMLKVTGIKKQNRKTNVVKQIIENARLNSKEFTEEEIGQLLELDMLSGDVWYAYAYISQLVGKGTYYLALFCSALFDCIVSDLVDFLIDTIHHTDDKKFITFLMYNVIDFVLSKGKESELLETFAKISQNDPEIVNVFYDVVQKIKSQQKKSSCVLRFCSNDTVDYVFEI